LQAALTYDFILYKKVLTRVVKRLVNGSMALQNKIRIGLESHQKFFCLKD